MSAIPWIPGISAGMAVQVPRRSATIVVIPLHGTAARRIPAKSDTDLLPARLIQRRPL